MNMTKTIKILMLGLFIAAGLVVSRVAIIINKTFSPATAARIYSPIKIDYGDTDDTDHDGLKDQEEAVWGSDPYNSDTDGDGFLDGEEVLSGHNPIQADDDSLAKQKEFLGLNSTQRLAQAITGGILSGDLKKGLNPKIFAESIDQVAGATVYSTLSALDNIEVGEDEIISSDDNSPESQEKYVETIFKVVSNDIMELIFNQSKELVFLFSANQTAEAGQIYDDQQKEEIKTKFLRYAIKFQSAYDQLGETPVPSQWIDIHKKILALLKKLELYHRSIALADGDSLKQMIVLGNLQNVYLESQPILSAINSHLKANRLNPPHSDFFSINSLLGP